MVRRDGGDVTRKHAWMEFGDFVLLLIAIKTLM
jgi:hypothetical protein